MIRIIRTATLDALYADQAALERTREELKRAKTEAESATDSAIRAENVAEQQLRDLAQAHADRIQAERERNEIRTDWMEEKAATDREMDYIRTEYQRIRAAANDPATGENIRAAIALGFLRDLYTDARANGQDTRALDMVALMCGFADVSQPATETAR